MTKKLLLLVLCGSSLAFFVKCSKDLANEGINSLAAPKGKGKPVVETVNNLSYPAIAVDGFAITLAGTPGFVVPYTGTYSGLTAEEIADLQENGPWYPQKTPGNVWQAEYATLDNESVTYIDWGDNIESVYPKIRTPFRLEVTLYKVLAEPMTAYTMAVLENPSSSVELQGTNSNTYDAGYATVISARPKLIIQYLGTLSPTDLTWSADQYKWTSSSSTLTSVTVSFAPELNVGGKYVYGASSGGWKPTSVGYYRITFYVPSGSGVDLTSATVASASDGFTGSAEGTAATPVVDVNNNLTYVDVLVKGGGGGNSRRP
jgi:hypothetical protein